MRRQAKRDAVEPAIVQALREYGWSVDRLNQKGLPDLLLSHRKFPVQVAECKSAKGKLTADQEAWLESWRGPKPWILRSVADVEQMMLELRP